MKTQTTISAAILIFAAMLAGLTLVFFQGEIITGVILIIASIIYGTVINKQVSTNS